jgi:hypothetical protein
MQDAWQRIDEGIVDSELQVDVIVDRRFVLVSYYYMRS